MPSTTSVAPAVRVALLPPTPKWVRFANFHPPQRTLPLHLSALGRPPPPPSIGARILHNRQIVPQCQSLPVTLTIPYHLAIISLRFANPPHRAIVDNFAQRSTRCTCSKLASFRKISRHHKTVLAAPYPCTVPPSPSPKTNMQKETSMANAAVTVAFPEDAEALLKTGALQNAILNSANFSSIATDEKGVIQIFNVGAERMLGYAAADVVNKITPADISDPAGTDRARRGPEPRARHHHRARASRPWSSRPRAASRTSTS